MVVRFLGGLVDVRREPAVRQRVAELHAQETRRRVAGDAPVVALDQPLHHVGPRIDQLRSDRETVVVDDRVDPLADRRQRLLDFAAHVLDVPQRADREALEVDEEDVLLRGVGEPARERNGEHPVAQPHRAFPEDRLVHDARRAADHGTEVHLREDVALEIDAGRDLRELQALVAEAEHAALGDVERGLAPLAGLVARKRPMLDFRGRISWPCLPRVSRACRRARR